MNSRHFVFLCVIAQRKLKDELSTVVVEMGGALVNSIFGRGYYESLNVADYLGFSADRGKVILTCLVSRENSKKIIHRLDSEFSFKDGGTGIAFAVPIDKISY